MWPWIVRTYRGRVHASDPPRARPNASANIRPESTGSLTYRFDFEQLVAGRTNLMTLIHTTAGTGGVRTFTLTVGLPTNAQMAQLETNHEWYRDAPFSDWNPTTLPAAQRRDLAVTIHAETASHDVWFDYNRLFADGVLDEATADAGSAGARVLAQCSLQIAFHEAPLGPVYG